MNGQLLCYCQFPGSVRLTISSTAEVGKHPRRGLLPTTREQWSTWWLKLKRLPLCQLDCDVSTIADVDDATTTITMSGDYSVIANFGEYTPMVAAGAGIRSGSRKTARWSLWGTTNTSSACRQLDGHHHVAAGWYHTVGSSPTAAWSPQDITFTDNAMSVTGRTSSWWPQAVSHGGA